MFSVVEWEKQSTSETNVGQDLVAMFNQLAIFADMSNSDHWQYVQLHATEQWLQQPVGVHKEIRFLKRLKE